MSSSQSDLQRSKESAPPAGCGCAGARETLIPRDTNAERPVSIGTNHAPAGCQTPPSFASLAITTPRFLGTSCSHRTPVSADTAILPSSAHNSKHQTELCLGTTYRAAHHSPPAFQLDRSSTAAGQREVVDPAQGLPTRNDMPLPSDTERPQCYPFSPFQCFRLPCRPLTS
ncbi:hypothetical protein CDEST_03564 [Colletotrichum destructivum]|uniref:Uncharacterized protein n=1 Tax=Colletotrichum destructivum TaxID=34406 RepID=A0AAX4I5D9_9PEZI|nr:hypothetical protein CDEST_03564 [Colletotrichum destructivum]